MGSRASFFNPVLFKKCVLRFWPLWCMGLLVWIVALPVPLISNLRWGEFRLYKVAERVLNTGIGGSVGVFIFSVVAAMAVYSFIYNQKSTGFFNSLPVNRTCLFFSAFAAGLSSMLAVYLVVFLMALGVEAAFGVLGLGAVYLLQWLAMVFLETLFFYGFASLCAVLTGNLFVLPAVYAILNFAVWAAEETGLYLLRILFYGMGNVQQTLRFLSPLVYLMQATGVAGVYPALPIGAPETSYLATGYYYNGWTTLGIYAAAGLVFTVLALLIFKKRGMESAGDVVAVRPLRPVFKYCLSVGCALVLATLINFIIFDRWSGGPLPSAVLIAMLLLGAFIGYFAAEMLNRKSLKVFRGRVWRGWAIVSALLLALALSCEFDIYGFETKLSEPSKVATVSISCQDGVTLEEPGNIAAAVEAHRGIIADKRRNEAESESGWSSLHISYYMADGSVMTRQYRVARQGLEEGGWGVEALMNSAEGIRSRCKTAIPVLERTISHANVRTWTPDSYYGDKKYAYEGDAYDMPAAVATESDYALNEAFLELTPAEAMELYACIERDMAEATIGLVWLADYEAEQRSSYCCNLEFELRLRVDPDDPYRSGRREDDGYSYRYEYMNFTPTIWSRHTNDWLREHDIKLLPQSGE